VGTPRPTFAKDSRDHKPVIPKKAVIGYGGQALARELKLKTNGEQMLASLEKAGLI